MMASCPARIDLSIARILEDQLRPLIDLTRVDLILGLVCRSDELESSSRPQEMFIWRKANERILLTP
jgi:hypothetical protein